MDLKLSHTFVTVHDQDQALTFYRDALGLEVRIDVEFDGMRWLSVCPPSQPDVEITLVTVDIGHPVSDHQALRELLAKGSLNGVIFRTDDVDTAFEKVRATGAEVLQEPIDQPYGVRDCAFRDPSGNMVRIGTDLPRQT